MEQEKQKKKVSLGMIVCCVICLTPILLVSISSGYASYMRNSYDYPVHIQEALS